MRRIHRPTIALADETHRVTPFEVFFDLVFVFAFTRVISFMADEPTTLALVRGLLLLALLWWSWSAYTWLGNQARADVGVVRAGAIAAMAAVFVVALVVPDSFRHASGRLDGPLTLALAYLVVRVLYVCTYLFAAAGEPALRRQLLRDAVTQTVASVPLLVGALLGGTPQLLLWTAVLVIDWGGGQIVSRSGGGWRLRSPGYFAERHSLVFIIALGESIVSVEIGIGGAPIDAPILAATLLGFAMTVCLWLLYFESVAPVTRRQLELLHGAPRARLARDAHSLLHFPLIAGVIYVALGIEQVLARLSDPVGADPSAPLGWVALVALYGGVACYLCGQVGVGWRTVRAGSVVQLGGAGLALLLLPVARLLPPLAALGLITTLLAALALYGSVATDRMPR
ncbi:low temperature requirement protein A [Plantactinospora sp. S1510]|uniref:Low temperature requirement protein A n=1 Tax=Plantactinospora alkalitolerans TaxID=2789879 RepID=A0ABS0GU68_9ACTN|nr:low temperature requirement protein A [Plantactinospora alkalitolerans]MBF9129599.1 low temperature requirement protein A [Plantactinospora alkalitolerans]